VSKTPAKKAPAKKATPAKPAPAAKKATTPAAKAAAPAKKAAAAPKAEPTKTAAKAKAAAPVVAAPPKSAPAPAPAPVAKPAPAPVVKPAEPPAPTRMSARAAKAAAAEAASAPAPMPPATSRFADRFAPPRPPTRQMNNLGLDTPKPAQKADPKLASAWKSKAGRDLTEAELLAMPDSEYMNDKQLEFFRARLQALKDDLLSNAGETTEHLREDTSIVPDPADRATIEEEHALELRTRDRERKLLKKISQSLGRIDSGDYGFCDETGEPIGLGRLIARPTATLSLEAQQRRELKQKMFGD
jgi:DnaK suppressor protein